MNMESMRAIEVFISYSPKDKKLLRELDNHLSNLKRQQIISSWCDENIVPGIERQTQIMEHLNTAQIILLLISPDFMSSDYCQGIEVKRAMERHEAKEARVIPVILRPVDWEQTPFFKLSPLPKDPKPITMWKERDEAYFQIARGITRVVDDLRRPAPSEDFTQSQRDFKDFKDKVEGKWKKPSDDSGDDTAQNKKSKDTGERISDTLKQERQITTFFTGSESKAETTKLPKTEEEFTEWYYGLGDYEQYYVLTAAVLHGAPVHEVAKRADSLYQFICDEVERRGNLLRSRSHQGDQWETQQRESIRFSDPLLRTISGRDLRKFTYTKTRKERGVERLYWQDADAYGLSTFGLHLLEFLCNEFISRGELGQFFLNALQQWSEESTDEVSRKATHSYGVILWCHDADQLKKIARRWAKEYSPRRTAELLDGAYEIYRVRNVEEVSDVGTSSIVLDLLKSWVKRVHGVLSTDEDEISIEEAENQANEDEISIEEAIKLGCAVASTYALIGKRYPDIALEGLERLLRLPLSNSTIDIDAILAAGVSTYVILTWSGRVRDVLEHLASSAEQLSHTRNLPRQTEKRREYRRQREVYLDATLEAFFLVAAASLTDVQKIQNIRYSLGEPLPPQPAIPDPVGRDVLLAFLLSRSEVKCQKYIRTLLCAAIVERKSKHAFGLLRGWAEIVLRIHRTQDKDAEETYETFLQFIVNLGRTVDRWCLDLQRQGLRSPQAVDAYKNRLEQWCIEGRFYSHPIGALAQEVLDQLGT